MPEPMFERPDGRPAANPLGLSLGVFEGEAFVTLRERTVAEGVVIRALDLALAEVTSPLELDGAAAETFQRRSTRLRGLVLDIDLALIADAVNRGLTDTPFGSLRLAVENHRVLVELQVSSGDRRAAMIAPVSLGRGPHRSLRAYVAPPTTVGFVPVVPRTVMGELVEAGRRALTRLGPQSARSLKRVGSGGLSLDPVDALMWAVMPVNGWKVPEHEDVPLRGVSVTAAGALRIVVGDVRDLDDGLRPDDAAQAKLEAQIADALAREEEDGLAGLRDDDLIEGRGEGVFRNLSGGLNPSNEPLVAAVLGLGAAIPGLHAELTDLAERLSSSEDPTAQGLAGLALGAIADAEGRPDDLRPRLIDAARAFRAAGHRRLAGLALLSAAGHAPAEDRARLLEETIALRADDVPALSGLVEVLPTLGRAQAAIRAARRLAHLSPDNDVRFRAHLAAGTLLRDELKDLPQARREIDRALKLEADHPDGLEALALTTAAQGDRSGATAALAVLAARAEAAQDVEEAARLLIQEGRLWLEDEPARALERYRRAHELAPNRVGPLAAMAEAAQRMGDEEVERSAVATARDRLATAETREPAAVLALRRAAARLAVEVDDDTDEAVRQLQAALRLTPDDLETLEALGRLHKARDERPQYARVVGLQAARAMAESRWEEAAQLFQDQAAALAEDDEGRPKIRERLVEALGLCPGHRGLLDALVAVSSTPAERLDALDRRLVLEDPPQVRAGLWVARARALEAADRAADAARAYEEALATHHAPNEVLPALLRIYRDRDEPERLALVFARVASMAETPHDKADALTKRALMLARVGRDLDAYGAVQSALDTDAAPLTALRLATKLAVRLSRLDDARRFAELRVAQGSPVDDGARLAALTDLAEVAEKQRDDEALIGSLAQARSLVDPASAEGRQLAARLAHALARRDRWDDLAALERERGQTEGVPPGERAERWLEAARLSLRLGHDEQAALDVEEALSQLGDAHAGDSALRAAALEIQERLAERNGDPEALAEVLGRRAALASNPDDRVSLHLEQAEVLQTGGREEAAVLALQAAVEAMPDALALAVRLGEVAVRAERPADAADAFSRAARLAESRHDDRALALHGRAAHAHVCAGNPAAAMTHDRAVLAATPAGQTNDWLDTAADRLHDWARDNDDAALLVDVLGRRAAGSPPEAAARLLLEKAEVQADRLQRGREALDALRRARTLAPSNSEVAHAVDIALASRLMALGQHAEHAELLVDRAERAVQTDTKAELLVEAARAYAESLDDPERGLDQIEAALRAAPHHREARRVRIELLRRLGHDAALAEALVEQAEHEAEPTVVADLLTDAATLISPLESLGGGSQKVDQIAVQRAWSLVRRAADARPQTRTLEAGLAYARALDRVDDELEVLDALCEVAATPAERARRRLHRAVLLDDKGRDAVGACDELLKAYDDLKRLSAEAAVEAIEALAEVAKTWLDVEAHGDPVLAALSKALILSRRTERWDRHLRALEGSIHRADDSGLIAELYSRAGDVFADQLLDASDAESAYRSAVRICPSHQRAKDRLRGLLVAQERFAEIADALGLEALLEVRNKVESRLSAVPRRRLLSAVVERLSMDGDARVDASLTLARLELDDPETAAVGVARLQRLVRSDLRADEALADLITYFEANDDGEAYCEALRQRAYRRTGAERALALTELAKALETRLDDSFAAERELQAALQADPSNDAARRLLIERCLADDRFEDLATALGAEALTGPVRALMAKGAADRGRAFRAVAAWIGAHPTEERTDLWLDTADAFDTFAEPGDDGLIELLERQAELATSVGDRLGVLLALAERLSQRVRDGSDDRDATAAEDALRAVLELDETNADAQAHLLALYEGQSRYFDIGRVLGSDVLTEVLRRAEARDNVGAARRAMEALAQLTEGAQRARLLLTLAAGEAHGGDLDRIESLYRGALTADPDNAEARDGFRRLLADQERYGEIGARLGVSELRRTKEEIEAQGPSDSLLPVVLALVDILRELPEAVDECTELWLKAAKLHHEEVDFESAEYALRMALANHPDHREGRTMLRRLLVSQDRLAELAGVDATLLEEAITSAEEEGQVDLQVRGLRVLAEQHEGRARADMLAKVAAREIARGRGDAAEADLISALRADDSHTDARGFLEDLLWSSQRFDQAAVALGAEAFIARAELERQSDPGRAAAAVRAALDRLSGRTEAQAFEMLAAVPEDGADADEDRERQLTDLRRAQQRWEALGDDGAVERTMLARVDLLRETEDIERRFSSLDDALAVMTSPPQQGSLMLEQVGLLERLDRASRALVIARRVLADEGMGDGQRNEAARMLVDRLGAEGSVRAAALERLVSADVGGPADRARWRRSLAEIREAEGADAEAVVELLEAALADVSDRTQALELRRRLLALHDELGDWRAAEGHAAALAQAEGTPEQWVTLSELRMWLDDRAGAKAALENAIKRSPTSRPAHESLVRLAEQEGATTLVMARLEAWADADVDGRPADRAERLLHAARLAVEADDGDRAADLAGRALTLVPRRDPSMETVARRAAEVLAPLGLAAARAEILTSALNSAATGAAAPLRLELADLLRSLDRADEAATVVEHGLHREMAEDDPLLERFVREVGSLQPASAPRRLLEVADRLGVGPAARRLRAAGAELAEAEGDKEGALTAWSQVGREVGTVEQGARARAARVRISRDLDDVPALLDALVEAADDGEDDGERAARLAEAADLAETRLEAPERAEQLLRRAIQAAPDPSLMQDALLDLLRRQERWMVLDTELAALAEVQTGAAKAGLCAQRAEIVRAHLHDEVGAAALYVEAYRAEPVPDRGAEAAAALERAGDAQAAEALLDSVMREVPSGSQPWLRVALAKAASLERAGRVDAATSTLRRIAEAVPGAALVRERQHQLFLRHRRWDDLAELLLTDARYTQPIDRIRNRLAAARILLTQAHVPDRAVAALRSVLRIVQGWLSDPQQAMPDHVVPVPVTSGAPSLEVTLDSPLLDLARLAAELGQSRLRVDALRLHAQSLPAGAAQQRALLLLAAAERESGDLDAAEFTLRGAVDAIQAASDVGEVDRVEADRALGLLLLDRGAAEDAVEALSRAEEMLRGRGQAGDVPRAEILVKLAQAYRSADRPRDAVVALQEARLLDDRVLPQGLLEEAVEAAGPSEALAELLHKRAADRSDPAQRASMLRDAARVWEQIGRSDRALFPLMDAYRCEPGQREEAVRLQELLYLGERGRDLVEHIEHRLQSEPLEETERVRLLIAQGRALDDLGDRQAALQCLQDAFQRQPSSVDVLDALAAHAAAVGRLDVQEDALARLAAATTDPDRVLRALIDRAAILERMDDVSRASEVLEDALERSLRTAEVSPRAIIDHLARLYAREGNRAAEARLWVRAAAATDGPQAAAYLARASDLRKNVLADRRGALAAIEAAIRAQPEALGLRWSVIELATSLGDDEKALAHAEAAATHAAAAGLVEAHVAFLKVVARTCRRRGEFDDELTAWVHAIGTGALDEASLDEMALRAEASGNPASSAVHGALMSAIEAMSRGRQRGLYRWTSARLLEGPLERPQDADKQRAAAADHDGYRPHGDAHDRPLERPDPSTRVLLERSARWGELAAAESARAAGQPSRPERAQVLVAAGQRILDAGQPDLARARALFDEALVACPDSVAGWAERARVDLRNGDADGAIEALQRLRDLGGAPWAPPQLELALARSALARGDRPAAMAAFAQARLEDPTHREPAAGLAELARLLPGRPGARRWFDEYRGLLDETLDAKVLAELCYADARQGAQAGDYPRALQAAGRALKLQPSHVEARRLRLEVLRDLGDSPFLLEALANAAIEAPEPSDAQALQRQAFELARRLGDRQRGSVLAAALEERAGEDPDLLLSLYGFYRDHGDHDGLLRVADRLGGIEALGPLPREQRVALASACFSASRPTDAFTLLVEALPPSWIPGRGSEDVEAFIRDLASAFGVESLTSPADQIRLRAVLADLSSEALASPPVVKALQAVVVWQPEARTARRLLASAYRRIDASDEHAVEVYRGLLIEDPGDVTNLESLVDVLPGHSGVGARAILSWIDDEPAVRHPTLAYRPPDAAFFAKLRTPASNGPLGTLLRLSAPALAGLFPPPERSPRRPAHEDPRVADVAEVVKAVMQVPLSVMVDGEGGRAVEIGAGDPCQLVVGEALAEDATPDELRFHLGRAAMLAELGFLLVRCASGLDRRHYVTLVAAAVDPHYQDALPPSFRPGIDVLRSRLDPSDRATAEAAVAALNFDDLPLSAWLRATVQTADRFGTLVAGAPAAALRALHRAEPRTVTEPMATREDRQRAIRRWRSMRDLVAFIVGSEYVELIDAATEGPQTGRF